MALGIFNETPYIPYSIYLRGTIRGFMSRAPGFQVKGSRVSGC